MKRQDIVKGGEYVMLTPSQRTKIDDATKWDPIRKRIRVLDTAPIWADRYTGWGGWDKLPKLQAVEGFDGETAYQVKNRTEKRTYQHGVKYVKALVGTPRYSTAWRKNDTNEANTYDYIIECVAISMVAMPWSEYEERRAAARKAAENADRRAKAEGKRKAQAKADALRQRTEDRALVRRHLVNCAPADVLNAFNRLVGES